MFFKLLLYTFKSTCVFPHLPINQPMILSVISDKDYVIKLEYDKARLVKLGEFPPHDEGKSVFTLRNGRGGFMLRFPDGFLCKRHGSYGLVPCEATKDDEDALWKVEFKNKGATISWGTDCLTVGESDFNNGSRVVQLETCTDNKDQFFDFREVPILSIGWKETNEINDMASLNSRRDRNSPLKT